MRLGAHPPWNNFEDFRSKQHQQIKDLSQEMALLKEQLRRKDGDRNIPD